MPTVRCSYNETELLEPRQSDNACRFFYPLVLGFYFSSKSEISDNIFSYRLRTRIDSRYGKFSQSYPFLF